VFLKLHFSNIMSASPTQQALTATWFGFVSTTMDALILFEACLAGKLQHVLRRPHDREREELINSGRVFVFVEQLSGIKRWTDGLNWSPSRVLGNFLIYRELEKPFPRGEKKKVIQMNKSHRVSKSSASPSSSVNMGAVAAAGMAMNSSKDQFNSEAYRSIVGSLVDSYPFKDGGLMKKTVSINHNGVLHHLVSYYRVEDAKSGHLQTPSQSLLLRSIVPRQDLIQSQSLRIPVDEEDGYHVEDSRSGSSHGALQNAHIQQPQTKDFLMHVPSQGNPPLPNTPLYSPVLQAGHPLVSAPLHLPPSYVAPPQLQAQNPYVMQPATPSPQSFVPSAATSLVSAPLHLPPSYVAPPQLQEQNPYVMQPAMPSLQSFDQPGPSSHEGNFGLSSIQSQPFNMLNASITEDMGLPFGALNNSALEDMELGSGDGMSYGCGASPSFSPSQSWW
jgi:hypothetical protein